MKTVIGADCRLGLRLAANLQGRDIPFVSISSRDPVLDSVKLLLHAFAYHGATQVVMRCHTSCSAATIPRPTSAACW